jgi:hypothetical protein
MKYLEIKLKYEFLKRKKNEKPVQNINKKYIFLKLKQTTAQIVWRFKYN